jgi:hypothetical protein
MVLKYCRLSDGNLSNSADIKGMIKLRPCRHTSEAETPENLKNKKINFSKHFKKFQNNNAPSSGALASGGAKSIKSLDKMLVKSSINRRMSRNCSSSDSFSIVLFP